LLLLFFLIFVLQNIKELVRIKNQHLPFSVNADMPCVHRIRFPISSLLSSPGCATLFRGDKGNNSFYPTKTFCKIFKVFFDR